MAATISSPWAKPTVVGSWALDSEENEAELSQQPQHPSPSKSDTADFPSLSAAVAVKSKKKKAQTLSLAEFSTYSAPAKSAAFQPSRGSGPSHEDLLALPTGPRERSAEELERNRLGGGFRSYGLNNNRGEDSSNSRWGSGNSRGSDDSRRNGGGFGRDSGLGSDSGFSRADETDNWASGKKSIGSVGSERRDRGGFFDSQSKADESDNWGSNKSYAPSMEGRKFGGGGGGGGGGGFERERRVMFEPNGGADAETWGRKKEEGSGRQTSYNNGGGSSAESETWGKKKEEGGNNVNSNGSGRPRLNLQARTLPVTDVPLQAPEIVAKPKGANPFGAARPREEVLAEKGQDWKKIDEQLEGAKIKEVVGPAVDGAGKRSFGSGKGRGTSPEERSWRKNESVDDARPQSAEKIENEVDTEVAEGN